MKVNIVHFTVIESIHYFVDVVIFHILLTSSPFVNFYLKK